MKKETNLKSILLSVFLCVCLCFSLCSCSEQETYEAVPNKNVSRIDFSDAGTLSDEEYTHIKTALSKIDVITNADLVMLGNLYLNTAKNEIEQASSFNVKGIPILVNETEILRDSVPDEIWTDEDFDPLVRSGLYWISAWVSLRVNYRYLSQTKTDARDFVKFTERAHTDIVNAINSTELKKEEKVTELAKYGFFSVPYAVREIEKGNTEYEKLFMYLGIHKSNREWTDDLIEQPLKYSDEIEDWHNTVYYPDFFNRVSEGYGDFDYKIWLSENEDDLNMVLKFLDAYTAEYEAEQNK